MTRVLSRRALNRATLARQWLLRKEKRSALEAIEHLVGMQAQAPFPPYYGLWTRLHGFQPAELAELLLDRKVVRVALMRGTVHLVSASDCLALRPLVQPIFDRDLTTNTTHAPPLVGVDLAELAAVGRKLIEKEPLTPKQLAPLLAERWPDRNPASLAHGVRNLLACVQVPPRGVWGRSGQPACTTAEAWLGRPLGGGDLATVVLRYLRAFGPASVPDVQAWSGLTRLREVVDDLPLRRFVDEEGRELVDVPDGALPDPDVSAPVRFLAEFDNVLLSHADRTRIIADDDRKRFMSARNGVLPGALLVDGFFRGTWKLVRNRDGATLWVEPYRPLSERHTDRVTAEGARLLRFAAPEAKHAIEISL